MRLLPHRAVADQLAACEPHLGGGGDRRNPVRLCFRLRHHFQTGKDFASGTGTNVAGSSIEMPPCRVVRSNRFRFRHSMIWNRNCNITPPNASL